MRLVNDGESPVESTVTVSGPERWTAGVMKSPRSASEASLTRMPASRASATTAALVASSSVAAKAMNAPARSPAA